MKHSQRNIVHSKEVRLHRRERRQRVKCASRDIRQQQKLTLVTNDYSLYVEAMLNYRNQITQHPLIMEALSYKDVFGNTKLDIDSVIASIPTLPLLEYVVSRQNKVLYAFSNIEQQTRFFAEMWQYLDLESKSRVMKHVKGKNGEPIVCLLFDNLSCMMVCGLALSHYNAEQRALTNDDICKIYKLLTYFTGVWSHVSKANLKKKDVVELTLLADVPISEFKLYKDPISQLYKACVFFDFCEHNVVFNKYLQAFCEQKGVGKWREYILRIFDLYDAALNQLIFSKSYAEECVGKSFIEQYVIDLSKWQLHFDDYTLFANYRTLLRHIRDTFIYQSKDDISLILNMNLLADKLYQGLKFELFNIAKQNKLIDEKGKEVKSFDQFCSNYGTSFSERHLCTNLLRQIFDYADIMLEEPDMRKGGIKGPADLYMRIGKDVFVIEFKDELANEDIKFSQDADVIKEMIKEKICREGGHGDGGNKGFYQVFATVEDLISKAWNKLECVEFDTIKRIFPIVITTDRTFSALGVNQFIREEVKNKMIDLQKRLNAKIYDPIIIDYDVFFGIGRMLHERELEFTDALCEFDKYTHKFSRLCENSPFNTFVIDTYIKTREHNPEDAQYFIRDVMRLLDDSKDAANADS